MNNTDSLQGPSMFQMPSMTGAANNAFSGIGGLNQFGSLGSGVLPQAQQTSQNLYNNPFASQGLQGAQNASSLGANAAGAGFNEGSNLLSLGSGVSGAGANLMGAGNSLVPYAGQIMQQGFDPQQALYNRTLQQVQDQANVNNSMAGVGTSPYGAGLTNQATGNFNIDWQNQQLQREALAGNTGNAMLQGAAGIANTGAGITNTGAGIAGQGVNMMNQAPGQLVQSAMLPYATYSDIGQGQNNALTSLLGIGSQGQGLANLPIQDLLAYLGVGNQAGGVANQQFQGQLNQANQSWNQNSQFGQGIGSMAGQFLPMLMGL